MCISAFSQISGIVCLLLLLLFIVIAPEIIIIICYCDYYCYCIHKTYFLIWVFTISYNFSDFSCFFEHLFCQKAPAAKNRWHFWLKNIDFEISIHFWSKEYWFRNFHTLLVIITFFEPHFGTYLELKTSFIHSKYDLRPSPRRKYT